MTQVSISNEPNSGLPRVLKVNLNNASISYSITLNTAAGVTILQGQNQVAQVLPVSTAPLPAGATPDPEAAAKSALQSAIEAAFVTFYEATNK